MRNIYGIEALLLAAIERWEANMPYRSDGDELDQKNFIGIEALRLALEIAREAGA